MRLGLAEAKHFNIFIFILKYTFFFTGVESLLHCYYVLFDPVVPRS